MLLQGDERVLPLLTPTRRHRPPEADCWRSVGGPQSGHPFVSLYIHIPFCEVKCGYCDFFSVPRGQGGFDLQREYTEALIREIETRTAGRDRTQVLSIFFGGGTPSLLDPRLLEKIMAALAVRFCWSGKTEITLEANPKTVTRERLAAFRSLGVNRLSVGVQSFQDKFLKLLGRIHSAEEAKRTLGDAVGAGFQNVNLDLIYGLPGQTATELGSDLKQAVRLGPTHLSAYPLTIESGTPFAHLVREGRLHLPPEDLQRTLFDRVRNRLRESGFEAYEISNFARPGFECRHNLNYWGYGEWWGFGAGAVSFAYPQRRQNVRDLKKYLANQWEAETEEIPMRSAMGEFFMMGLRKRGGVSLVDFRRKFDRETDEVYATLLDDLVSRGWAERAGDRFRLSERGIPVANSVMEKFL